MSKLCSVLIIKVLIFHFDLSHSAALSDTFYAVYIPVTNMVGFRLRAVKQTVQNVKAITRT